MLKKSSFPLINIHLKAFLEFTLQILLAMNVQICYGGTSDAAVANLRYLWEGYGD